MLGDHFPTRRKLALSSVQGLEALVIDLVTMDHHNVLSTAPTTDARSSDAVAY